MPLDEPPAHRLRTTLGRRRDLVEKAMFGRVGFLLSGNLCCGVWKEWIILRVGPERYQEALAKPFARGFDFTGRALRGWVMVESRILAQSDDLRGRVANAVAFVETLPPKGD